MKFLFRQKIYHWNMTGIIGRWKDKQWFLGFSFEAENPEGYTKSFLEIWKDIEDKIR